MGEATMEESEKLWDQIVSEMRGASKELAKDEFLELVAGVRKLLSTAKRPM